MKTLFWVSLSVSLFITLVTAALVGTWADFRPFTVMIYGLWLILLAGDTLSDYGKLRNQGKWKDEALRGLSNHAIALTLTVAALIIGITWGFTGG
jgi:hypothetical protein